jgi:tetratricopeptide (TPR) repeat protein
MVTSIFSVISIIYAFRSLQIGRLVYQNWGDIRSQRFTKQQKSLAQQASFFLAVPVAVIFHEFAHALATWLFGGQVVDYGYFLFWGFIQPAGTFTAANLWFIALAGTIGSLLFGLGLWLVLRLNSSPSIRYFGLRAFRFQIFFSLIYYPVFTLLGFYGDWRTIYDFSATPILSGLTAAAHALLLFLFWWADRIGWFEMATFDDLEEHQRMEQLRQEALLQPHNSQLQLQLIDNYRRSGSTKLAKKQLQMFLKENPNSAEGYLQQAAILTQDKGQIPKKASESAAKALGMGLSKPADRLSAHNIVGQYSLDVGQADEAIKQFNQGIEAAQRADLPIAAAHMTYLRGVAHRRKGQSTMAYQDVQLAISQAQALGQNQQVSLYQRELETIEHQSRYKNSSPPANRINNKLR